MAMGQERWKVITPSEFSWEQEAFDYLRANLPDADPCLAWQGFNFIMQTGNYAKTRDRQSAQRRAASSWGDD